MVKSTMNVDNLKVIFMAVVATSLMLQTTEAALYKVGDDLGWTIPPGGAATYAAWAAKHSFVVNDMLMFNFTEGDSDLALVTMEAYAACNTTNPLYEFEEPMTLKFLGSDTFYFTSTYEGHCIGGQKIAIYIAPSSSPCPSPVSSPPAQGVKFVSQNIMRIKRN